MLVKQLSSKNQDDIIYAFPHYTKLFYISNVSNLKLIIHKKTSELTSLVLQLFFINHPLFLDDR